MKTAWTIINNWLSSFKIDEPMLGVYTILLGAAFIIITDLIICLIASVIFRRLTKRHNHGAKLQEKLLITRKRTIRFLFALILCIWFPAITQTYALLAVERILNSITIALGASAAASIITWIHSKTHIHSNDKHLSSKALAQVAIIIIWCAAVITIISTLIGKSPAIVLSGFGAMTAILMLIFKDSILGLVAGVQVAQNDMVRVGDWITMTKYNADGTVIDIALTTIKVQNFDNTVTMIPSSALISDSFINWRYMSVSKGRRIKRPVWISATTITELTPEMHKNLTDRGLLAQEDKAVSNLEAFEIWIRRMLQKDERISKELTCMVRQTDAGAMGIPVEVYCFTKTRDWVEYEYIQTQIFDLIFVTAPKFNLEIYERSRATRSVASC